MKFEKEQLLAIIDSFIGDEISEGDGIIVRDLINTHMAMRDDGDIDLDYVCGSIAAIYRHYIYMAKKG